MSKAVSTVKTEWIVACEMKVPNSVLDHWCESEWIYDESIKAMDTHQSLVKRPTVRNAIVTMRMTIVVVEKVAG